MVQRDIDELRASSASLARRQLITLSAVIFVTALSGIHLLGAEPKPVREFYEKTVARLELDRQTPIRKEVVASVEGHELPTGISIPKIGVNAPIVNPSSTSLTVLDGALQKGVVRYPGSAAPQEKGTIFLFGHSSGLPVVQNQNYKVFNRLRDLTSGDEIVVNTETHAYIYRVASVSLVADSNAVVEFQTGSKKLVLSTCNTFGKKQDRYVVSADFVASYPVTTF